MALEPQAFVERAGAAAQVAAKRDHAASLRLRRSEQ